MVLSGPSGAGKSTLLKKLMKDHEGVFGFSVSRKFVGQQAMDLPILPEGGSRTAVAESRLCVMSISPLTQRQTCGRQKNK